VNQRKEGKEEGIRGEEDQSTLHTCICIYIFFCICVAYTGYKGGERDRVKRI
jgi:hypothetical protein